MVSIFVIKLVMVLYNYFNFLAMNIQAENIELAQLLLQTEDVSVLEAIKNIFKSEKQRFLG